MSPIRWSSPSTPPGNGNSLAGANGLPTTPVPPTPSLSRSVPEPLPVTRAFIKPLYVNTRASGRFIDIGIDQQFIHGFCVVVKHHEGDPESQVRTIRASLLKTSTRTSELIDARVLDTFTLPKVPSGTQLFFDYAANNVTGNVVCFECLSTYGSIEMCTGLKVNVY